MQKYRIKNIYSEFAKEIVSPTIVIVREVKEDPDYFIGPRKELLSPLPEGWTKEKNNGGTPFYYHTETERSQWARPKVENAPPLPKGWDWEEAKDGSIIFIKPDGEKTQKDPRVVKGGRRKSRKRVSFRRRPRSGTRHKSYRVKSK